MRILAIVLIIFGVVCLIYQGLAIVIPKEVIDLGFLSISIHENRTIPLPPILGLISLAAGIGIVLGVGRAKA